MTEKKGDILNQLAIISDLVEKINELAYRVNNVVRERKILIFY